MAFANVAQPLTHVQPSERVNYLKRVLLWTTGGLMIAGGVGIATAVALYVAAGMGMTFLLSPVVSGVAILGSFAVAHWVAPKIVFGGNRVFGFGLGTVFEGISLGYILLAAVMMGAATGNPLGLIISALTLTGLTGACLTAYVWSSPKEFKMLGAGLSAVTIPMLVLMAASFVVPSLFGGTMGILLTGLFVVISAAGLLYQINAVLHRLNTDQHIEGAYLITMGILVLFWNILSLLMRLRE